MATSEELLLGLSHEFRGPTYVGHLLLLSQMRKQGAGSEVDQSGLEPELIWVDNAPCRCLVVCATALGP